MTDIHTKKEADTSAALGKIFDVTEAVAAKPVTEIEAMRAELEQVKLELNEVKIVVNKLVQKALEPNT